MFGELLINGDTYRQSMGWIEDTVSQSSIIFRNQTENSNIVFNAYNTGIAKTVTSTRVLISYLGPLT